MTSMTLPATPKRGGGAPPPPLRLSSLQPRAVVKRRVSSTEPQAAFVESYRPQCTRHQRCTGPEGPVNDHPVSEAMAKRPPHSRTSSQSCSHVLAPSPVRMDYLSVLSASTDS